MKLQCALLRVFVLWASNTSRSLLVGNRILAAKAASIPFLVYNQTIQTTGMEREELAQFLNEWLVYLCMICCVAFLFLKKKHSDD